VRPPFRVERRNPKRTNQTGKTLGHCSEVAPLSERGTTLALQVSIRDLDTGSLEISLVPDGEYLLVLADPCRVTNAHQMADGAHLLTIAGTTKTLPGAVLL
jgi:hypothetical protein